MESRPVFRVIAEKLRARGIYDLTPVSPDGKRGVQKRWNNFQLRTPALIERYAGVGTRHEFTNVAVVSHEGVGNLCFLDPDAPEVLKRIEGDHKFPDGYRVATRPQSDPERIHHYFLQTEYSVKRFREFFRARDRKQGKAFQGSKSINIKSLTEFNDEGGHLNLYDFKGIGKKSSFVVAEGSIRADGQVYTCVDDRPVPKLPNWLVEKVISDLTSFEDGKEAHRKEKLLALTLTEEERTTLRRQNLPDGFDIAFEDKHDFLLSRSFPLAAMGLSPVLVEQVLIEYTNDFIHGGREWIKTDKAKRWIHEIANNSELQRGNMSWFYLRKERDHEGLIVHNNPQFPRHDLMVEIVTSLPDKLKISEAYDRIECDLKEFGETFDRESNADQLAVRRARAKCGFEIQRPYWIRKSPVAVELNSTTGESLDEGESGKSGTTPNATGRIVTDRGKLSEPYKSSLLQHNIVQRREQVSLNLKNPRQVK